MYAKPLDDQLHKILEVDIFANAETTITLPEQHFDRLLPFLLHPSLMFAMFITAGIHTVKQYVTAVIFNINIDGRLRSIIMPDIDAPINNTTTLRRANEVPISNSIWKNHRYLVHPALVLHWYHSALNHLLNSKYRRRCLFFFRQGPTFVASTATTTAKFAQHAEQRYSPETFETATR